MDIFLRSREEIPKYLEKDHDPEANLQWLCGVISWFEKGKLDFVLESESESKNYLKEILELIVKPLNTSLSNKIVLSPESQS